MPTAVGTIPAAQVRRSRLLKSEALTGYFLISPAVFLLLVLLAYPFILAVWISMTDRLLEQPDRSNADSDDAA